MEGKRQEDEESQLAPARVRARDVALVVERVATITEWIARGMTPRACVTRGMRQPPDGLGMSRYVANRYVGVALMRLQKDDDQEPIESKRARSIAFWNGQIQRALENKRTFEQNGEVIEYAAPDLKAANQARAALDQIEGLVKLL